MALSKALEDLIVSLPEEERATMRAALEKHEILRQRFEGNLRQQDYDAKMNEVKATEKAAKEAVERADAKYKENQKWYDENNPKLQNALKEKDGLFKQVADLEAKLKLAAASAPDGEGGKVDENKLIEAAAERIKTMGIVPDEASLRKIMAEEAGKIAITERDNFLKQTLPASMEFQMSIADIAMDHRDEFKEKFDRAAFIKFMNEKELTARPPREAYDVWVAERRQKAHDEDLIKKTEERVRSERSVPGTGESSALAGLPGASAIPEEGPMVTFLKAQKTPAPGTGAGVEAAEAAKELRSEGKY